MIFGKPRVVVAVFSLIEFSNLSDEYLIIILNSVTRLPVLSVEHAAKCAVNGILTDEVEFTIPSTAYFTNTIRR